MDNDTQSQCYKSVETDPLVWVHSFDRRDCGRALSKKQTILDAMKKLRSDPSIGAASPIIPGKASNQINDFEDIGTIGAQKGVIVTTTASIPDGAMEIVLIVAEKLTVLEEANEKFPGLIEKVLGVKQRKFNTIAKQLRGVRNRLAHPDIKTVRKGKPNFMGIPQQCRRHARLLLNWDALPFRSTIQKPPLKDSNDNE
jgi:hypothetical protein